MQHLSLYISLLYIFIAIFFFFNEVKTNKMVVGFCNFCKLDGNDVWEESCGSTQCSQNHNIRKNTTMLPSSCSDMNWPDFLGILDCYHQERVAVCNFCKNCNECHKFKWLCAEAWGIALNSWRKMARSYVAVWLNCLNQKYPKMLPMTVDILNRIIISVEEEKLYIQKEQEILYDKIINKYWDIKKWWF